MWEVFHIVLLTEWLSDQTMPYQGVQSMPIEGSRMEFPRQQRPCQTPLECPDATACDSPTPEFADNGLGMSVSKIKRNALDKIAPIKCMNHIILLFHEAPTI